MNHQAHRAHISAETYRRTIWEWKIRIPVQYTNYELDLFVASSVVFFSVKTAERANSSSPRRNRIKTAELEIRLSGQDTEQHWYLERNTQRADVITARRKEAYIDGSLRCVVDRMTDRRHGSLRWSLNWDDMVSSENKWNALRGQGLTLLLPFVWG